MKKFFVLFLIAFLFVFNLGGVKEFADIPPIPLPPVKTVIDFNYSDFYQL